MSISKQLPLSNLMIHLSKSDENTEPLKITDGNVVLSLQDSNPTDADVNKNKKDQQASGQSLANSLAPILSLLMKAFKTHNKEKEQEANLVPVDSIHISGTPDQNSPLVLIPGNDIAQQSNDYIMEIKIDDQD